MAETKNVYRTLYPASLERLGLVAALKGLFQETRNKTSLNIHFFHEPIAGELSAEYRVALFRIVQEALANVIKYASAGDVHVNLTGEGGVVYLSIEDDGQGFDPKELKWRERDEKLMGLRILKERVYQLGGRFDIDARPGHGVLLTVELPLSVTETKGVDDE
jgi:signal transduction histidine kinase